MKVCEIQRHSRSDIGQQDRFKLWQPIILLFNSRRKISPPEILPGETKASNARSQRSGPISGNPYRMRHGDPELPDAGHPPVGLPLCP
jgi:hypothetical protein